MVGIFKKCFIRNCNTKSGKSFQKFVFVIEDKEKNEIYGEMSESYAREYFKYCSTTTKELLGKEVSYTEKQENFVDKNGENKTVKKVKYLNIFDSDGKPIIMSNSKEVDF